MYSINNCIASIVTIVETISAFLAFKLRFLELHAYSVIWACYYSSNTEHLDKCFV